MTMLHRLMTHCEFGTYLNDVLRDCLVCKLCLEGTQRRLLATKDLTLQEAVNTALSMEAAEKDSKPLQGGKDSSVNQVFRSQAQPSWKQSQSCYRCGKANHQPSKCHFIGVTCRTCIKPGHIAAVCNSGKGHKSCTFKQDSDSEQTSTEGKINFNKRSLCSDRRGQ